MRAVRVCGFAARILQRNADEVPAPRRLAWLESTWLRPSLARPYSSPTGTHVPFAPLRSRLPRPPPPRHWHAPPPPLGNFCGPRIRSQAKPIPTRASQPRRARDPARAHIPIFALRPPSPGTYFSIDAFCRAVGGAAAGGPCAVRRLPAPGPPPPPRCTPFALRRIDAPPPRFAAASESGADHAAAVSTRNKPGFKFDTKRDRIQG